MGGNELFITLPYTEFQSTHPVWDGTAAAQGYTVVQTISIHPSRVGWDPPRSGIYSSRSEFQSTHPVWDGTLLMEFTTNGGGISIHPSRVGWDAKSPSARW